jgi:hypothetical protein
MHLAPAIVQQIYGAVKELDVIALEPDLERLVTQALTARTAPRWTPAWPTPDPQRRRHRPPPGRPGPAGLPAGARPDPRTDGAAARVPRRA